MAQREVTKISQATVGPDGVKPIVAFNVTMEEVPSDDPIAYSMGFMQGYVGHPLVSKGEKRSELAQAYVDGHALGRKVKTGTTAMPDWAVKEETK